jgi:hypothetical protein
MTSKTLTTVILIFLIIMAFPLVIGFVGGVFGLLMGAFGAVIGLIAGAFGIVFGTIGKVFGSLFHWHIPGFFGWNIFPLLIIGLILLLITRRSKNNAR